MRDIADFPKAGLDPGNDLNVVKATCCTDISNAVRIASEFGSYLRFASGLGDLCWDNRRWAIDDLGVTRKMLHSLPDIIKSEAIDAPHEVAEALLKHAKYSGKTSSIDGAHKELRPMIAVRAEAFDDQPELINTQNCTVRIVPGECPEHYPHSKADNITCVTPFDWHMGARRLTWESFLQVILPSPTLREFIQRAVGYSALGLTREQCFFVLFGIGKNGKSTFLNAVLRALGPDYATQADPKTFMVRSGDPIRADIARLRGKRFVSAVETGAGGRLDEAMIKAATGGDPLVGEFKYQNQFVFTPQFHLWLATNHKPRIDGTDYGIWRRVMLVPFTVTISDEQCDKALDEKLRAESEGILDWIIEGACKYLRDGLNPPEEVLAATAQYRQSEDVVGRFLSQNTLRGATMQVSKAALFTAFEAWCSAEGERVQSKKKFGQYVAEQGFEEYCNGSARYWIGLGLIAND